MNWPPGHYMTKIYINIDILIQKNNETKSAKTKAPEEGYIPSYILTITKTYITYKEPVIYAKLL